MDNVVDLSDYCATHNGKTTLSGQIDPCFAVHDGGIGIDTVTHTHVPDVHVISTLCNRTHSFLVANIYQCPNTVQL